MSENIADNTAIVLAYIGLEKHIKNRQDLTILKDIQEFESEKLFFIYFAHVSFFISSLKLKN